MLGIRLHYVFGDRLNMHWFNNAWHASVIADSWQNKAFLLVHVVPVEGPGCREPSPLNPAREVLGLGHPASILAQAHGAAGRRHFVCLIGGARALALKEI
jgi:hypothetical protein